MESSAIKSLDAISNIAINTELLEKTINILEKRIVSASTDLNQRYRLADIYRQLGKIDQSVKILEQILEEDFEHSMSKALHSALTGKLSDKTNSDLPVNPARFFQLKDFLPKHDYDELFELTLSIESNSEQSLIVDGCNTEVRNSLTTKESYFQDFANRYRERLKVLFELEIGHEYVDLIENSYIELQMNAYGNGAYFLPHRDRVATNNRKFTCVYYYFLTPTPFEGGDLILYDYADSPDQMASSYTRLIPEDNSLVIFPSKLWHQVTPVKLTSHRYKDFRFSLTSWLHLG